MMLDALMIHPGGKGGLYQNLANEFTAIEPPLWCRLIASYLRTEGWSADIWDTVATDAGPESVARSIKNDLPRLVVVVVFGHQPSASTEMMSSAAGIVKDIKHANPQQEVAIVGGHVSALPEEVEREVPADYIIVGEGPKTIDRILKGQVSPGICGKDESLIQDIDNAFIWNVWNNLPMSKYRAHNWQCLDDLSKRSPYASIFTSLGCPYKCHFCCINAPFGGNYYRTRSPAAVITEISHLYYTYGVKTFKIIDEMFVLNKTHVAAICSGLKKLPFVEELNIWAYARVDTVTSGMLEHLQGSGIKWLALGIESGNDLVRDGANKVFNDSDIFAIVRAIQGANINVMGNYIFGLPNDTFESMEATMRLAYELNTEFANFYSAMAYPGSPLHAEARPEDLPSSWRGYSQHSYETRPLPNKNLSSSDILMFRDEAFQTYFRGHRYLDMIAKKFGGEAAEHVTKMVRQPLRRQLFEEVV